MRRALNSDSNYKEKVQDKIDILVDRICKNNGVAKPSLYQLAMFMAMQIKALKSREKKNVEYEYWQERGWFQKDYYTNGKINLLKKIYSKIIRRVIKKSISGRIIMIKEN